MPTGHGLREDQQVEKEVHHEQKRNNFHYQHNQKKFNAKILSSEKVIGDPGNWTVHKDSRVFDKTLQVENVQSVEDNNVTVNSKFDVLQEQDQTLEENNAENKGEEADCSNIVEKGVEKEVSNNNVEMQKVVDNNNNMTENEAEKIVQPSHEEPIFTSLE
ncbi:hypothetical protein RND71_036943 [Anisodus tanguticus]|uniref:Uncharacterized protein n=1 Tax=Anisodus tanguticus TaxID=243964 RepID=A0AAE1R343_9SOLA|nr:hypothetical protein RND71_036943 [Anisodus tanguticus]